MAINNTTKMANRYGLDIELYEYKGDGTLGESPLGKIDFANEVSLELTSDTVWATGGQAHSNMIGFNEPFEGTLTISTQVVNMQILHLIAGDALSTTGASVVFKNDTKSFNPKYYIVKGTTVWQGNDGTTYSEEVTCYKACVKPGYKVTYNGSGDPQSLDVEFQLAPNDNDEVVKIDRKDAE